jgi:ketosteroid isomerase-like protein
MAPSDLIDRWLDSITDPACSLDDIADLLDPDVRFVERPNRINPEGTDRDLTAMLQGVTAGHSLLAWQRFDQRTHEVIADDRVVSRARWQGEVAREAGPLKSGRVLTAHVAMFFTLRGDRVLHQENYDCFVPF